MTFTAPNPGSVGTTTYQFGYDSFAFLYHNDGWRHGEHLRLRHRPGPAETLTYPAQIITDGTNYSAPDGGSGGSGTITSVGVSVRAAAFRCHRTAGHDFRQPRPDHNQHQRRHPVILIDFGTGFKRVTSGRQFDGRRRRRNRASHEPRLVIFLECPGRQLQQHGGSVAGYDGQ